MKEDVKRKWVEALRSGKYQQGKTCLRQEDTYCCLGVLCDIRDPGQWQRREPPNADRFRYVFGAEDIRTALLSEAYREEIGLSDEDEAKLVSLNDAGSSFGVIAQFIEEKM